ncbi:small membrane A-kinase anchor protein [Paroedura picta]|uniref:small membrane A-kinase anchor protein n=1 Tax=Paroedura picta TaxID=143630 RepID=UPI004056DC56
MGCIKSKGTFSASNTILDDGSKAIGAYNGGYGGDAPPLIQGRPVVSSSTSTVILDFAHRLSQEILDQAVKQWAVTESKYSDIPFIESDVP